MVNMISGGLHAGGNLDFQDYLIMPGATDYPTALEQTVRVYRQLGRLLGEAGFEGRLVGDEGGYGPRLPGQRRRRLSWSPARSRPPDCGRAKT